MKFKTVREMEEQLKKVTSLKELQQDITFVSQGQTITVRYLGQGPSGGVQTVAYLGDETSDMLKVSFNGEGNNISVTEVKINRT